MVPFYLNLILGKLVFYRVVPFFFISMLEIFVKFSTLKKKVGNITANIFHFTSIAIFHIFGFPSYFLVFVIYICFFLLKIVIVGNLSQVLVFAMLIVPLLF